MHFMSHEGVHVQILAQYCNHNVTAFDTVPSVTIFLSHLSQQDMHTGAAPSNNTSTQQDQRILPTPVLKYLNYCLILLLLVR